MSKRKLQDTSIDANRCGKGYYWVRYKSKEMSQKTKIMECRNGETWWDFGWDIQEREMEKYVILGEVAPPSQNTAIAPK